MLLYAAEGDFRQAFLSNPVIFCGSPFLVWILGRALRDYNKRGRKCLEEMGGSGNGAVFYLYCSYFFSQEICVRYPDEKN